MLLAKLTADLLTKLCLAAESMALEASARVAVTNAIENKDDLGRMLGTCLLTSTMPLLHNEQSRRASCWKGMCSNQFCCRC